MAMYEYNFVFPFREAKFCVVPSCVFNKLRCAAGEKCLQNTSLKVITDGLVNIIGIVNMISNRKIKQA
jgi:hypothetical protein